MNPLADEFESRLTREVFKWISAFFAGLIIFMTLLNLRLGMLTNLDNPARMLVRTFTMVLDIAVCLWAFRSKASDEVFLRVPPVPAS